eukprot:UN03200
MFYTKTEFIAPVCLGFVESAVMQLLMEENLKIKNVAYDGKTLYTIHFDEWDQARAAEIIEGKKFVEILQEQFEAEKVWLDARMKNIIKGPTYRFSKTMVRERVSTTPSEKQLFEDERWLNPSMNLLPRLSASQVGGNGRNSGLLALASLTDQELEKALDPNASLENFFRISHD